MSSKIDNEPQQVQLFRDLNADDPDPEASVIESVCMNCFENGQTRIFLTKIPFYKEVVLMSFRCDHCGFNNNEIQSAGELQKKGCRITLTVTTVNDLNRRIVKSDYSSIEIPEIKLEVPSQSQKGEVTTLEGIIERTVIALEQDQVARRQDHPETAKQIDDFIDTLRNLKNVEIPFTVILEDISGNCHIESFQAPHIDSNLKIRYFDRTKEQDKVLGIYTKDELNENNETETNESLLKPIPEGSWPLEELMGEVMQFQTQCPNCRAPCETNMKMTSIPHFKEVVIMATNCDHCGLKTNEVKSGGGMEDHGVKFELKIGHKEDLSRDILKSETCSLKIADLDCEVGPSALGGRFTTVEGLLIAMKEQMQENGLLFEDSQDEKTKANFDRFLDEIDNVINMKRNAVLILDDPAGNSYVQSLSDDDNTADDRLTITKYTRTFDQNEELGINDMKTENY